MKFGLFSRRKSNDNAEAISPSRLLGKLCGEDESLYRTLMNYLIYEPIRQLPSLGSSDSYQQRGLIQKARGNSGQARSDFEWAARINICQLNTQKARENLLLADEVSDDPNTIGEHRVLLSNLDKIEGIARAYYKARNQLFEQRPEVKGPLQIIAK